MYLPPGYTHTSKMHRALKIQRSGTKGWLYYVHHVAWADGHTVVVSTVGQPNWSTCTQGVPYADEQECSWVYRGRDLVSTVGHKSRGGQMHGYQDVHQDLAIPRRASWRDLVGRWPELEHVTVPTPPRRTRTALLMTG